MTFGWRPVSARLVYRLFTGVVLSDTSLLANSQLIVVEYATTYYTMMKIFTPSSAFRLRRLSSLYRSSPGRRR